MSNGNVNGKWKAKTHFAIVYLEPIVYSTLQLLE